jgi:predicted regulator of Ras-like GTPase activity (Roadblock/LC7/MglB family)
MSLKDQVKTCLERIRHVKGVENVILTQRDGNPIQSAGVWLSKNEIFTVSSATSAIYNLGFHLHRNDLKYILIEGNSAKIFFAPLKSSMKDPIDRIMIKQGIKNNIEEFFIAITSSASVNLGGVFLQTRQSLKEIKRSLILSGESFKPPLRKFDLNQVNKLIKSFNIKEESVNHTFLEINSLSFSSETIKKINTIFKKMAISILSMKRVSLTTSGGFLISKYSKTYEFSELDFEHEAAMAYSLYSTSNRCAWLLRKMKVNSILLECDNHFQFISPIDDGILILTISKGKQKLGLLRLIIPRFLTLLKKVIKSAKLIENPVKLFDIKSAMGEICLR